MPKGPRHAVGVVGKGFWQDLQRHFAAEPAATEDEIREFCKGKIVHFKIPQYIRFVDSFPMTVTGKIQKFRMREVEIEERGLRTAARYSNSVSQLTIIVVP